MILRREKGNALSFGTSESPLKGTMEATRKGTTALRGNLRKVSQPWYSHVTAATAAKCGWCGLISFGMVVTSRINSPYQYHTLRAQPKLFTRCKSYQ